MNELEPWLRVHDVAARYRVSAYTVRAWLRRGALRGRVVDGHWVTTWDAVFAFEGRLTPPTGHQREAAKAPLYTVSDIAAHLRISEETVRRRCRRGAIAARRIGGAWFADHWALVEHDLARAPDLVSHKPTENSTNPYTCLPMYGNTGEPYS